MCSASFLVIFAPPFVSSGLAERKEKQRSNDSVVRETSFMFRASGFLRIYSSKSAAILHW
jgi:hypothetical protein